MENQINCPSCGATNDSYDTHCEICWTLLDPKCLYCGKEGVIHYTCGCDEFKNHCARKIEKLSKNLFKWLSKPFTMLPPDTLLGIEYENGLVEWGGGKHALWFKIDELSRDSGVSSDEIRKALQARGLDGTILRMANSDPWVLQDPFFSEIMHAHLRIKLVEYL